MISKARKGDGKHLNVYYRVWKKPIWKYYILNTILKVPYIDTNHIFSSVQSLSHVRLFVIPWTTACQASLVHHQLPELTQTHVHQPVMQLNHLLLCRHLLLPPSNFPSIRVISNKSVLHIRWPKYWSFSFSISPFNEYSGFPLEWTGWTSLLSKGFSRIFSNTTVQKHQLFGSQLSL